MNRFEVHRAWAPNDGRWSAWVKPVLFATLDEERIDAAVARDSAARAKLFDVATRIVAPLADTPEGYRTTSQLVDVAIIVDLPGARSVDLGVGLVPYGFVPVPLFNALPASVTDHTVVGIVDVEPIIDALVANATTVADAPPGARPAFLLDANRLGKGRSLDIGRFDNRSVCHPSDFPSADTLWSHGIRRAVLVAEQIADDVEPTLAAWHRRGIAWWRLDPRGDARAIPFAFHERWWLGRALRQLTRAFRAPTARADGSYGLMILPAPSSS